MMRRGFTLLEVLLALAVIGITFAVLAATQVTTLQVTSDSRRASVATEYANTMLENAVQDVLTNYSARVSAGSQACVEPIAQGFTGSCTVETVGSGYLEAGLMRVTVTLTEPAPVSFSRLVSCMDVQPPPTIAAPAPCPGGE